MPNCAPIENGHGYISRWFTSLLYKLGFAPQPPKGGGIIKSPSGDLGAIPIITGECTTNLSIRKYNSVP
jgi:hypothetical protein